MNKCSFELCSHIYLDLPRATSDFNSKLLCQTFNEHLHITSIQMWIFSSCAHLHILLKMDTGTGARHTKKIKLTKIQCQLSTLHKTFSFTDWYRLIPFNVVCHVTEIYADTTHCCASVGITRNPLL